MTRKATTFALAILLLLTTVALASDGFALPWTVVSGGGTISGGAFVLDNAIGQPAAAQAAGGAYSLASGFWAGAGGAQRNVYLPVMLHSQ